MYLYILEDGTIKQSPNPPNEDDIRCIEEGIWSILHVHSDGQFHEFVGPDLHSTVCVPLL